MRSHQYQFTVRELALVLVPTAAGLVALAGALNFAHRFGWLPQTASSWDPDRTVLAHQARACHHEAPAQLIVTGDSTCLVGVDALQLSKEIGLRNNAPGDSTHRALQDKAPQSGRTGKDIANGKAKADAPAWRTVNLALYIWLDLRVYGELVSEFAGRNPGKARTVVLLVSPAKLIAQETSDEAHREFWNAVRSEAWTRGDRTAEVKNGSSPARPRDWAGAHLLREHFLSYALATPLRGSAAAQFGFSSEIDAYMTHHHGSVITFGTSVLPRRVPGAKAPQSPWVITPAMAADSRAFRAQLPPGAKLFIGLTPGMAGARSPDELARRLELLQAWNASVQADALLTNLPPVLPDVLFSSGGHLNATGQRVFTRLLGRELAPFLSSDERSRAPSPTVE